MSNEEFEAKKIHESSLYLEDKLKQFKENREKNPIQQNVYIVEDKKSSLFQKIVNSFFK